MPILFGEMVSSVDEIVRAFQQHGDRVRGTYRAHYRYDVDIGNPYAPARLERPASLADNPPDVTYPWEAVFLAAATCAGSDYPIFAAHLAIPIERVDFVVEGVFDPRGEFDGLSGFQAPPDARDCYLALNCRATIVSPAPRPVLSRLHELVIAQNMVLNALRGIPRTSELLTIPVDNGMVLTAGLI